MSESIWKKEISFGKKAKPAAAAPAPEAASEPVPLVPPVSPKPARSESIWKKEISFGKKSKQPALEQAEPAWPEQKERWWNKEIGGSRKQPEPQPAASEPVASQPVAPEAAAPQSVAPQPLAPAPAAPQPVEPAPAPVVPPQPAPVDPALQGLYEQVAPQPVAEWGPPAAVPPAPIEPAPVVPAPAPVEPAAPAAPEPATAVLPSAPEAETSVWKKELSFKRKPKQAKLPKQATQPTQEPAAGSPQPKSRRRLPSPRLSLPALPSLGKSAGGTDRLVGLKIGGSQIAAARINNNGVAELVQLARMPLQSGIVVGGELRDPEALASALRTFFADNKLPRRNVRLGVASSRIGVRIFEIAGIQDDRQFVNAVRFRAQEALPIPLDEAVLDYRVLSEGVNAEGEPVRRVLLVVAHKDLVERYTEACRLAGIQLAGIDLEAFALLRSLAPPAERNGSALVAVAIGHERTTLAVSDGQVCEFTRVLEWGGWAINVALARALDAAPGEVEAVKRTLSLAGGPVPEGLSPEQAQAATDAVRRSVESLARDLVSSLQYYQGQPGSLGIGEVILTGGTAHLVGLAEELERLLGVGVHVGDPLRRLKVGGAVAENDIGSLAIAIGLGIED